MPASDSAALLDTPPAELAVRIALGCAAAIWLGMRAGPLVIELLIPYLEAVVQSLDSRYRITFAISYRAGHGGPLGDLSLLGQATVSRLFFINAPGAPIIMQAGTEVACATAIGVLMQPAVTLLALALGYPAPGYRAMAFRALLAIPMAALWLLAGLPFSLWLFLHDIPINAFAPGEGTLATPLSKMLLNGGGVALGVALGAASITGGGRLAKRLRGGRA